MIITLLRKPLEGSVADNTLKHGCGAINIDATRVGTEARSYKGMGNKVGNQENATGSSIYWMSKPPTTKSRREGASGDVVYEVEGRWPANFILTHKEGCELVGTKKVKSGTAFQDNRAGTNSVYSGDFGPNIKGKAGYADKDGNEEIADWACVEGCPVKELDQQSGILKSGGRSSKYYADTNSDRAVYTWKGKNGVSKELKPSVGGASRFFKQFKKEDNQ